MTAITDIRPSPTASWAEISAGLGRAIPPMQCLTPAERVVASYLSLGLSNREIAVALGKSEATVKNQISACLQKLGVATRLKLLALLR